MNEAKDSHIHSIYKVTRYNYKYHNIKKCHWPEFKLDSHLSIYYNSLTEAEEYIKDWELYTCWLKTPQSGHEDNNHEIIS